MKIAVACLVLLLTGCGKVGAPLPPFIRIPERINDLNVRQDGTDLILTWTNPATYIDGSAAADLGRIQIRSNDAVLMEVNATGAGKPQTIVIPVGPALEVVRSFAVIAATTRGNLSQVSNTVSITPIAVPGKVARLRAVVDQRRITLTWEKPQDHPELADSYRVLRISPPETQIVSGMHYEDLRYRPGETYTYQVTAMRGMVPGVGPESVTVLIEDKIPPQVPSELGIVVSDTQAFVTWAANGETDFAGYRVFRNGVPVSDRLTTANSFVDPDYSPNISYSISAVDEFGNESAQSPPLRRN